MQISAQFIDVMLSELFNGFQPAITVDENGIQW
jgi:hypothetical protein